MNFDPKIGDHIRHRKRGSDYEVLGFVHADQMLKDGSSAAMVMMLARDEPTLVAKPSDIDPGEVLTFVLPVSIQTSAKFHSNWFIKWVIYRSLKDGAMIFARPLQEFTTDRFEVLK